MSRVMVWSDRHAMCDYTGGPNLLLKKHNYMKKETLLIQHQQHKIWLNYLAFYKDEMQIFQNRLEEVAQKYTDQEIQATVEHFQNQFILQKEQHDILRHDIKALENRIESAYEGNTIEAINSRPDEELVLTDRVETFARLFHQMKEEFYQFVARYL